TRVADMAEAVQRANASRFALGSAVFAGNKKKAMAAARALRSGMTSINSVIAFAAVPSLPFGGGGDSGFCRIPRAGGLPGITRAKGEQRAGDEAAADPAHDGAQRQGHAAAAVAPHVAARQALPLRASRPPSGPPPQRIPAGPLQRMPLVCAASMSVADVAGTK